MLWAQACRLVYLMRSPSGETMRFWDLRAVFSVFGGVGERTRVSASRWFYSLHVEWRIPWPVVGFPILPQFHSCFLGIGAMIAIPVGLAAVRCISACYSSSLQHWLSKAVNDLGFNYL